MISLRKINSLLAVIILLMLLHHALLNILFAYGVIDYSVTFIETGRRLVYPLTLHVIISLYLYISNKMKGNKLYPKLIGESTQQFITGIGVCIFVSLHILSHMLLPDYIYTGFNFRLLHFLIEISMFAAIFLHLRISVPRLAVSFGFLEGKNSYVKFKSRFNIVIFILLLIAVLAVIIDYWVIL